jgi:hypothetical protein
MNNTKKRSSQLAAVARVIAMAHPDHIMRGGKLLPLAKEMMFVMPCDVSTAKRHIAKQLRLIRGELVAASQHGGKREGAGYPAGFKRNGRRGKAKPTQETTQ